MTSSNKFYERQCTSRNLFRTLLNEAKLKILESKLGRRFLTKKKKLDNNFFFPSYTYKLDSERIVDG